MWRAQTNYAKLMPRSARLKPTNPRRPIGLSCLWERDRARGFGDRDFPGSQGTDCFSTQDHVQHIAQDRRSGYHESRRDANRPVLGDPFTRLTSMPLRSADQRRNAVMTTRAPVAQGGFRFVYVKRCAHPDGKTVETPFGLPTHKRSGMHYIAYNYA